jgi:hypothetical protein
MYIESHLVIIISPLLESVYLCPKMVPLSGLHCSTYSNVLDEENKHLVL